MVKKYFIQQWPYEGFLQMDFPCFCLNFVIHINYPLILCQNLIIRCYLMEIAINLDCTIYHNFLDCPFLKFFINYFLWPLILLHDLDH